MLLNNHQTIPCPVCKTAIPFDTKQLLQGVQFTCPNCSATIGLAEESMSLVRETLEAFEETRQGIATSQKQQVGN